MDSRKIVFQETGIVLVGEIIGVGLMLAVFALLGRFSQAVVLGGLVGGFLSVMNFFVMAVTASLAADKAEQQDVKGGKSLMQFSYLGRFAVLFLLLFACAKSGLFDVVALVVPLIFVRPTLTLGEFFRKSGEKKA